MFRIPTPSSQFTSAQDMVVRARIEHDALFRAYVILGVSPKDHCDGQRAHFCPAKLLHSRQLRAGDGTKVPISDEYEVVIKGGLPVIEEYGFLCFDSLIHPNGVLTFEPVGKNMLLVPIRGPILGEEAPFARQGGLSIYMEEMRCRTPEELLKRHGQLIAV